MGGKDLRLQPRLRGIRETPPGWLRLVICTSCGHQGVLPAERMLKKYGQLALLEFCLVAIRCSACGGYGATMKMVRLCDPACPRLGR